MEQPSQPNAPSEPINELRLRTLFAGLAAAGFLGVSTAGFIEAASNDQAVVQTVEPQPPTSSEVGPSTYIFGGAGLVFGAITAANVVAIRRRRNENA